MVSSLILSLRYKVVLIEYNFLEDNTLEAEGENIQLIDTHSNDHIEDFLKDNCKYSI